VGYCPFCGVAQGTAPDEPGTATLDSPASGRRVVPAGIVVEFPVRGDIGTTAAAGHQASNDIWPPVTGRSPSPKLDAEVSASRGARDPGPPSIPLWQTLVCWLTRGYSIARSAWRRRRMLATFAVVIWLVGHFGFSTRPAPAVKPAPTGTVTVMAILPNGSAETIGTVLADGQRIGAPGVPIAHPAGSVMISYVERGWSADEQRVTITADTSSTIRLHLHPIAATASAPTPFPAPSDVSPAFQQGLSDRQAWEVWFASTSGEYHNGALYWSAQRSSPHPGSCTAIGGEATAGCLAAQLRLGPSDSRRKREPDYRLGWNSYATQ